MGKSSIVLAIAATLGLGALIGASLVDGEAVSAGEPASPQNSSPTVVSTGGAPVYRFLNGEDFTVEYDDFDQALPALSGENIIGRGAVFKTKTVTFDIGVDGSVEYKALMQQGDSIVYNWSSDGGQAYYDFHAHSKAFDPEFFTRYNQGEGIGDSGSIVAAYAGQHGWYWLNIATEEITITLEVAGFYSDIVEIDLGEN
jgi:hypothetical protein